MLNRLRMWTTKVVTQYIRCFVVSQIGTGAFQLMSLYLYNINVFSHPFIVGLDFSVFLFTILRIKAIIDWFIEDEDNYGPSLSTNPILSAPLVESENPKIAVYSAVLTGNSITVYNSLNGLTLRRISFQGTALTQPEVSNDYISIKLQRGSTTYNTIFNARTGLTVREISIQ